MPGRLTATIPALPALLVGFFLMQTGNTFQGTILSIRGEIEGFTLAQIGAVGAGFWAGVIIGSLRASADDPAGWPHSNFRGLRSHRRDCAACAPSRGGPIRMDRGAGADRILFRGDVHCRRELAQRRRELRKQGTDLKHLRHDRLLAGVGGQLLLPTTDPAGFRAFCIIACIISVALVPVALTQGAAPAPPGESGHVGLGRLYRDLPLGVAAGFLSGVTTGAFFTLGPIFAERRGLARVRLQSSWRAARSADSWRPGHWGCSRIATTGAL